MKRWNVLSRRWRERSSKRGPKERTDVHSEHGRPSWGRRKQEASGPNCPKAGQCASCLDVSYPKLPSPFLGPLPSLPRKVACECWCPSPAQTLWRPNAMLLTSWSVDNIILSDVGCYLAGVCPFVARFFFRWFLFVLLGGLLRGGTIVVIILIFTVIALGIIFGSSFQGTAPAWPWILTLSCFVSFISLSVPISVPVLLFVFVFVFVSCHDSPRAFFCPLTARPPWKVDSKPGLQSSEFLTQFQGKSNHSNYPNASKTLGNKREKEKDFTLTSSHISFLRWCFVTLISYLLFSPQNFSWATGKKVGQMTQSLIICSFGLS